MPQPAGALTRATWRSIPPNYAQNDRLEITGTRGVISINRQHRQLGDVAPVQLYRDGVTTEYRSMEIRCETNFDHPTPHGIEALRRGEQPPLSRRDARDNPAFALASQESGRTGATVGA